MKKLTILIVCLMFFAVGCKMVGLYHDLSEEEANNILVLLSQNGVKTNKVKEVRQNEIFWVIEVEEKNLSKARELLVKNNLPRKSELGLSGVYKDKGLIPTPDEQKARYVLALKGELINSFYKMPEIVNADVVINVPTKAEFDEGAVMRPTASVILRVRSTASARAILTESKIQQFVANSVDGLNPRDVSVIISYVDEPQNKPGNMLIPGSMDTPAADTTDKATTTSIMGIEVDSASAPKLKVLLIVILVFIMVLAAALILTIIRFTRKERAGAGQVPEGTRGQQGLIEGDVIDEDRQLGPPNR